MVITDKEVFAKFGRGGASPSPTASYEKNSTKQRNRDFLTVTLFIFNPNGWQASI